MAIPKTGAAGPLLEKSLKGCDTLVIGPGMGSTDAAEALLRLILTQAYDEVTLVVDALAIGSARDLREALVRRSDDIHTALR